MTGLRNFVTPFKEHRRVNEQRDIDTLARSGGWTGSRKSSSTSFSIFFLGGKNLLSRNKKKKISPGEMETSSPLRVSNSCCAYQQHLSQLSKSTATNSEHFLECWLAGPQKASVVS